MEKGIGTSVRILGDWISGTVVMFAEWVVSLVLLPVRLVEGLFTPNGNAD